MPEARSCVGRVTIGMGQPARGGIRAGCGTLRYFQTDSFGKRLNQKSRMKRELPVRFREGLGVQFPRATRLLNRLPFLPGEAQQCPVVLRAE